MNDLFIIQTMLFSLNVLVCCVCVLLFCVVSLLIKLVHGKVYKTKHKLAIEGVNEFINTSEKIMNTLKNAKSYLEESSRFLKMPNGDILKLEGIQVSKSLRAMRDNRED